MPRHPHSAVCLKRAEASSTIVRILSEWHFDFSKAEAKKIVKHLSDRFKNRGNETALATAQAMFQMMVDLPSDLFRSQQPVTPSRRKHGSQI